ncbi:hypothetical protein PybrP1_011926 [[Pythium] brassicae (nom. inval.)]|nr:hypothetical protein PybrP1_011926 [[Pythium] brassicae (nom. inval.)]
MATPPPPTRAAERLVLKFAATLRNNVRLEPQHHSRNNSGGGGLPELPWLSVRMDDSEQTPPPPSDARWRRVREKLEAVGVLSMAASCRALSLRRNPRFWTHLLAIACGLRNAELLARSAAGCPEDDDDSAAPAFLLDFSFMEVTPDVLHLCRTFLTAKRRVKKALRIRYTAAMNELEALARPQQRAGPLRLRVGFVFHRCELTRHAAAPPESDSVQQLEAIIAAVAVRAASTRRLQLSAATDPTVWSSFFYEITSIEFSALELVGSDFARLEQLVADPSGGLCVLVLNKVVASAKADAHEHAAAFGGLLRACFGVGGELGALGDAFAHVAVQDAVVRPARQQRSLERFVFDWNALDLSSLSSLFSAVRASAQRAVAELSLVGTFRRFDGDPALPWAWLAFGVLHRATHARVQSLDLSSNALSHDDVSAMRRVLATDSVCDELLGATARRSSEKTRVMVRLKQHASLWKTPDKRGSALLKLSDGLTWFEMFDQDRSCVCVLIPGYGVLWTDRRFVSERKDRHEREQEQQQNPRRLQKLMLNAMVGKESERVRHGFRDLLPLVGGSLLHLEIRSNPLSSPILSAIVTACPHLQYLDISNCELGTIGPILNGYERGECRIATLLVAENEIGEQETRRLCSLLRYQSSLPPSHRLPPNAAAGNLRFLDLDQNPIGRQGLLGIGKVLAVNKVLEVLVLSRSEDPDGQLRSRYAVHDDEFLGVRQFGLRQKLAVLSAAHAMPALNAIDVPVLQVIFAFSGAHVHRRLVWK